MKKHRSTILLLAVLLIGLSLLLYPSFSDWWNSFHQSRAIDAYSRKVEKLDEESYASAWKSAWEYNKELQTRENRFLLTQEQKDRYQQLLNLEENGIMGYLEIPAIDVMLPIYHGAGEEVLQVAVGHLEWTSLPVGGQGSHCVLSGHRGLPSARLFTDLDAMEEGDPFLLHVMGETLTYQVDQILVVEPHETEELMLVPGEDFCTLVTCTPYGINSHRMLVRGKRMENQPEEQPVRLTADAVRIEPVLVAPVAAVPILLLLLLLLFLPEKQDGGEENELE